MARKIFGPVRQAAYDAAVAAEQAAKSTSDDAKKHMYNVTAKAMQVLDKVCELAEDAAEGKLTFTVFGKKVPFTVSWNIKEEDK